jgi:plasmid stabilization system protein ParE
MKVRFTDSARSDIDQILSCIHVDNPTATMAVSSAIKAAVGRLKTFPGLGARTDRPDIFMMIARPYHYLIFYGVTDNTLVIRSVRHPARQRSPSDQA